MIKRTALSLLIAFGLLTSSVAASDTPVSDELDSNKSMADWATETQLNVVGALTYPEEAYSDRLKGTVIVRLKVSRDGKILSADIVQSSGIALFDAAAKELVKSVTVPALPDDYPSETMIFDLKLKYDLTEEQI